MSHVRIIASTGREQFTVEVEDDDLRIDPTGRGAITLLNAAAAKAEQALRSLDRRGGDDQ